MHYFIDKLLLTLHQLEYIYIILYIYLNHKLLFFQLTFSLFAVVVEYTYRTSAAG